MNNDKYKLVDFRLMNQVTWVRLYRATILNHSSEDMYMIHKQEKAI